MKLKRNIILPDASTSYPYQSTSRGGGNKLPKRMREKHASALRQELRDAEAADTAAEARGGMYLRFNSSPGYELEPDAFGSVLKLVGTPITHQFPKPSSSACWHRIS